MDTAAKTAARVVKDFILDYCTQWCVKGVLRSIEVGKCGGKELQRWRDKSRENEGGVEEGVEIRKGYLKAKRQQQRVSWQQ